MFVYDCCVLYKVEKNKERLKLEQGDDDVKDSQITRLIEMERVVRRGRQSVKGVVREKRGIRRKNRRTLCIVWRKKKIVTKRKIRENSVGLAA